MTVAAGSTASFLGQVTGAGNYPGAGTVEFLGGFSPGSSPALVTFGGDLVLGPGVLVMELGGTGRGSQYDAMKVALMLTAGGNLDVVLINGFMPMPGDAFDLFDFGSISGFFDSISLPVLQPGMSWDTSQLYSQGLIATEGAPLPLPEPASLTLLGAGSLLLLRRRRPV